jgi:hypothetical protein
MTRFDLRTLFFLTIALLLVGARSAHAAQSYDNCTGFITSVPAVINTQGTWCLKQDLATAMTSGSAITIATNNVTIDCNNFKLGGLAAGDGTAAWGIRATDRENTTVRHCNIRGFEVGIVLESNFAGSNLVEDNRLGGNTYVGMNIDGDGSTIQRNRVFDTGGSTLHTGAYGIVAHYDVDLLDNSVSGVAARAGAGGSAVGIQNSFNNGNSVNRNRVSGLLPDGAGLAIAIFNTTASNIAIRDNDLFGTGIVGSVGIACQSSSGSAKNNVIGDFATPIQACSDDGGNSVHP